jgi:hypothetical protein
MLQLKNATPFAAEIAIFPNEQGVDTLYTIVKATFNISSGNAWTLADEQLSPQAEDEYWGEPGQSSIKMASDFHTGKPATDIIMLGSACAIAQQQVNQLDVTLSVGEVTKTVRVIGDRVWLNGQISGIKPFTSMPIVYEKAFGGRHDIDQNSYLAEERNPIGCGFSGKRSARDMEGTSLPNIEDPNELISYCNETPGPTGFGFCSPDWMPRRAFAGTYDEYWQKNRAPYLPLDFDNRFLNAAHPDLIYPGYLKGGELISVVNMHPEGEIRAVLPEISVSCEVDLKGQTHRPLMNLETLIIEPNSKQVSMVWRAAFECDKYVLKINQISLKLSR